MEEENLQTPDDLHRTIFRIRYSDASEEMEKLALRCIQRAQELKDDKLEFEAREAYINVSVYLHKPDQAIAMFPWLLKKCDEDRQRYDYFSALWAYKWILSSVKEFASIPLEKIDELMEDAERRYREYGNSEKLIHYFKFLYYSETGRTALAEEEYKEYKSIETSGRLDDCEACQPNSVADHFMGRYKYKEVLEIIDPVITGKLTCRSVPASTYHMAMISHLMLGQWEQADYYCARSRKALDMKIAELYAASSHLVYYGIMEDFGKGRTIFTQQFPHTLKNIPDLLRFEFFTGALLFFQRLKASGRKTIKLALPENKALYEVSGVYTIDRCISYARQQVENLSSALDKRNGNDFYVKHAQELEKRYAAIQKPVAAS